MEYDILAVPASTNGIIHATPDFLHRAFHPDLDELRARDERFAQWEQELQHPITLDNGDIIIFLDDEDE